MGLTEFLRRHWMGLGLGSIGWAVNLPYFIYEYIEYGHGVWVHFSSIEHGIILTWIPGFMIMGYLYDRKQMNERKLAASESRHRTLVENAQDGINIVDREGNFVFVNQEYCRMLGYTLEELVGKRFTSALLPEAREEGLRLFKKAIREPVKPYVYEGKSLRKDGSILDVQTKWNYLYEAGRVVGTMAIVRDITERKRAEEALRLHEVRLQSLLDLNKMVGAGDKQVLDFALDACIKITGSRFAYIALLSKDESRMTIHSCSESVMEQCTVADAPLKFHTSETGLWSEPIRQRKPVIVNDYVALNQAKGAYPEGHVPVKRFLGVPVLDGKRTVATAVVANKAGPYNDADVKALTSLLNDMWRIIQRNRAEEEIKGLKSFNESVINGISDAISVVNVEDYRLAGANDAFLSSQGLSRDEALGMHCYKLTHGRDSPCSSPADPCPIGELVDTGSPATVEHVHRGEDNQDRFVEVSVYPIKGNGTVKKVVHVSRDITERKKMEQEILKYSLQLEEMVEERTREVTETRDYLQSLIDGTADAVITIDLEERVTSWNRGAEKLYGYRAEEVLGKELPIVPPNRREDFQGVWEKIKRGETIPDLETVRMRKDGSLVEVSTTISPVKSAAGDVVGMCGIQRDITLKKGIERKLKEYSQHLEERVEERTKNLQRKMREFKGLYEVSDMFREELEPGRISGEITERIARLMGAEKCCIITYDPESMDFSPLAPAWGFGDDELKDLNFSIMNAEGLFGGWVNKEPLVLNEPGEYKKLLGFLGGGLGKRNFLLTKLLVGGEFLGLLVLADKGAGSFTSDDARLAHILASRLGAALHTMILFKELRESEAELRRYSTELERSNNLKGLFTDIMRHDLLNPVSVIKGVSQILRLQNTDEVKEGLERIEKNALKLEEMIESAARLSRLDDEGELSFEEEDLNAMFSEVLENLRPMFEERGIEVEYRPKGACPAKVSTVIEDVFANILSNAIKYSPSNTTVTVDIADDGDAWKLMVADEGEGIEDVYKEVIFDRFERGGKEGVKGTGLGLAIVKRVVELHSGRVWVEDNHPKGSIFYVLIPKNGWEAK